MASSGYEPMDDKNLVIFTLAKGKRYHKPMVKYVWWGSITASWCGATNNEHAIYIRGVDHWYVAEHLTPCKRCYPETAVE